MFVVGVTGGIGSGKTTATDIFKTFNVPVIDADIIAREIVEPGTDGLIEIIDHFGLGVLQEDGTLDRRAMRTIIFDNPEEKAALKQITHPKILECIKKLIADATAPYVILVSPLMFETDHHTLVDRVLVIDCPEELQIERTSKRDADREE